MTLSEPATHDTDERDAVDPVDPVVREQLLAAAATRDDRRAVVTSAVRRIVVFTAFVALLGLLYVAYKQLGRAIDDRQRDWPLVGSLAPRTADLPLPPLGDCSP